MKPIAIDPPNCACTECIVGEYVPLVNATPRQITDMLAGRLGNNTGLTFSITFTGKFDSYPQRPFSLADADTVMVTTEAAVRTSWGVEGTMTVECVEAVRGYVSPVPLFDSGTEAAEHGLSGHERPTLDAATAIAKILHRRSDLR